MERLLSGIWRCLVGIDEVEHLMGGELLVKTTSKVVLRSDLLSRGLIASDESSSWTDTDLHEIDDENALLI